MTRSRARRHRRPRSRTAAAGFVLAVVGLLVVGGVAWAFWSAASVPGGGGSAAASTMPQGAAPAAAAQNGGSTVVLTWAARTLASGPAVAGYQVARYPTGSSTAQPVLSGCTGTVVTLGCSETGVPTGSWQYTVTPVLGTSWRGAESARSASVGTDGTAPGSTVALSGVTGGAFRSGGTIYYRGVASGSFTLTTTVTDAGTGPASSQTAALTGTSTGWSHAPSTVTTPVGGPYVSNPFTWAAATTSSPGEVVTARDGGGNTTGTALTFIDDSSGPSGSTVSYADGRIAGSTTSVTFSAGTDAGSGLGGTRLLQRASAPLTGITCGTYTAFSTVTGGTNPTSPFVDTVGTDSCYKYQYVVPDNVGNATTATSTAVAHTAYGAHYAFDAGFGTTAVDSSGNGNTATLQGAGAGWTTGKIGAGALAVTPTGSSDVPYPVIDSSRSYTVSSWVRLDSLTGFRSFVSLDGTNVSPFYFQKNNDGQFAFFVVSADSTPVVGSVVTGLSPITNVWYHLAGVFDSTAGTAQLYVDGVSQGTATGASSFRATGSTVVGRAKFNGGPVDYVSGAIDDVRLDGRVLSPAEIAVLADGTGPTGGSVDATGLTGTGSRFSTSTTLSLALAKGTDPSGLATTGSTLLRSAGTLSAGACTAFGAYTQVGAQDPSTPRSDTVADQACYRYRYVVPDTRGNATTYTSGDIKVDTTAPSAPTLAFSGLTNASATGSTVYYRPAAATGGFTVTAAAADAVSGVSGYAFPALGTGWSSTAGATGVHTYAWAAPNPAVPAAGSVTATNSAGRSTGTTLTVTPDSTGPTVGTVSYVDGSTGGTTTSVAFTAGTDAGSGVGARLLQRATAPLSGTTCGTYSAFGTVAGGTDPTSPLVDSVPADTCNTYRYVVSDKVGNITTATSPAVARTPYFAHYAFDAGSGTTAVDSSGNANTGTLGAGAGWTTGRVGPSALNLTGSTTSSVSVPYPVIDTGASYTVSAWVKVTDLGGFQTVAGMDGDSVSPFYLQKRADGRFAFGTYSGDGTGAASTFAYGLFPTAGVWYHLAGVYDHSAGSVRLYVDGVLQSTVTGASSFRAAGATTIGRAKYGGAQVDFLNGALDEVRLYDRVLTGAEITALAQ